MDDGGHGAGPADPGGGGAAARRSDGEPDGVEREAALRARREKYDRRSRRDARKQIQLPPDPRPVDVWEAGVPCGALEWRAMRGAVGNGRAGHAAGERHGFEGRSDGSAESFVRLLRAGARRLDGREIGGIDQPVPPPDGAGDGAGVAAGRSGGSLLADGGVPEAERDAAAFGPAEEVTAATNRRSDRQYFPLSFAARCRIDAVHDHRSVCQRLRSNAPATSHSDELALLRPHSGRAFRHLAPIQLRYVGNPGLTASGRAFSSPFFENPA